MNILPTNNDKTIGFGRWFRSAFALSCAALAIFAFSSCNSHSSSHDNHEVHDHEVHGHHHAESKEHHSESEDHHDDDGLILLDHHQLEKLGIEVEEVTHGEFADVIKVSGEISAMPGSEGVVASRQAGIVKLSRGITAGATVTVGSSIANVTAKEMSGGDPNEAARIAYQSAKRELDRLTPLHKEGIVSTKDYNAALQRVEEAEAQMCRSVIGNATIATAPIAGVITSLDVVDGQFVDAGQTIATISSNKALTLRADLPESKVSQLAGINGARFRPSYSEFVIDVISSGGKLVSKPTVASASAGYIPIYFSLPIGNGELINGTYCEVFLLGESRNNVIAVPEESVSEQQGKYFVYVEKMHCHFEKRPVVIGTTDGVRREIISGLHAGEKVVIKGMTFVRLAEVSGVMPEGHSHSH